MPSPEPGGRHAAARVHRSCCWSSGVAGVGVPDRCASPAICQTFNRLPECTGDRRAPRLYCCVSQRTGCARLCGRGNITIEYRAANGNLERLPGLAAELVQRGVAAIATSGGPPAALAAKRTTETIPIVFASGGDPVQLGLVSNRAGQTKTSQASISCLRTWSPNAWRCCTSFCRRRNVSLCWSIHPMRQRPNRRCETRPPLLVNWIWKSKSSMQACRASMGPFRTLSLAGRCSVRRSRSLFQQPTISLCGVRSAPCAANIVLYS